MTDLADVLGLAERGWPVFPGELTNDVKPRKVPIGSLVEHGFKDATRHPRRIATWWKIRPDSIAAVALPPDTVALDVDHPEEFEAAGLELPDGPGQQTPSGGYHRFFRTDGRRVRQTVKEVPGSDTRVAGRGYVFAWQPDMFPDVETLPDAPEWLYGDQSEPEEATPESSDEDLLLGEDGATHRTNLLAFAGRLRWAGATGKEIYSALVTAREDGRIVDGDPGDPWTEANFRQIAKDLGSKPGPEKAPVFSVTFTSGRKRKSRQRQQQEDAPPRVEAQTVEDLLREDLRPLEYLVEEILPEGYGLVAGAPKIGKSWLTLQTALEVVTGGELLGRDVAEPRPVLYYGLEDGKRRFQSRLQILIGARSFDLSRFWIRYDAPLIGAGLEDEICEWLDGPGQRGLVVIDVLAKVRPASKGRDNAYNEDYSTGVPLQEITKDRPGCCIAAVTHDRKATSEDWLSSVTGSRGVVGSADWVWVVTRERLTPDGHINVTGRDIERDTAIDALFDGVWALSTSVGHGRSDEQDLYLDYLRTDGDLTAGEIADLIHPDEPGNDNYRNAASLALNKLVRMRLVTKVGRRPNRGGVVFHAVTMEEKQAVLEEARQRTRSARHSGGIAVRWVSREEIEERNAARAPAPAGGPPSTLSTESTQSERSSDGVDSVDAFPRAGARVRAGAGTPRGRFTGRADLFEDEPDDDDELGNAGSALESNDAAEPQPSEPVRSTAGSPRRERDLR